MASAADSKRYRDRKAGRTPAFAPLQCSSCGANRSGKHGDLCHSCWLKTPAGKEWHRLRVQSYRLRQRLL